MRYFFIILLYVFIQTAYSDTVYLKNGNQVTGKVISKDKSGVTVKMAYGKIFIPRKDVQKIVRESFERTVIAQSNRLIALGADYQGIAYLKRAMHKYPKKLTLKNALADVYFQLGRKYTQRNPKKALDYFSKAQKLNEKLDILPYSQKISQIQNEALEVKKSADEFLQTQNYPQALQKYQEAAKLNPDLQHTMAQVMSHCASQIANKFFRSKQYIEALEYFELALKQYPKVYPYIEQPWLYSKTQFIMQEHMSKQDWNGAVLQLQEILKHRPDYALALFLTGSCLEKLKDYERAYQYYGSVVNERKPWDRKFTTLEQARLRSQEVVSRQSLRPFFVPQDTPATGNWIKSTTEHFNVFYQNKQLAEKVASTLEYHWQVIQKKLAPQNWDKKWPQRCDVYIFPSRQEYMKNTGLPQWSDGVTQMAFRQGRLFQHKVYLYASAPLLLSNIIPHELTHVMYPWFLRYRTSLPLWLNEGIAMTSEANFRTRNRKFILKRALKSGNVFPIAQLLTMKQYPESESQAAIFYSQSLSVVEFLLQRGGSQRLLLFAQKAGSNAQSAIQEVYNIRNFSTLERLWLQYANN